MKVAPIDSPSSRIAAIAAKEMIDTIRDRRTVLVTLMPALLGPLFLVLVLHLVAAQSDKARVLVLPVAGAAHAPALIAFLERQQVEITPAPADFEARVRDGDLDVALEIDAQFGADVAKGKPGIVRLYYDRSRDRARASIDQADGLLRAYNREWGRSRLVLRGVSPDVTAPLDVEMRDFATPQSAGSIMLFLVAFYGLFAALIGGLAAALDATAGERERASLEPLLTTPARPLELALGKWAAVVALDATVVLVTLVGFYATLRFTPLPPTGIPFLFSATELGRFLVVLVPLMLLIPAVILFVGARGRTFREAQANVSLLLTFAAFVPFLPMFLQRKDPPWLTWIPVSGQYSLLSRALRGEALPWLDLLQSCVLPLALTALTLALVARLLSRESVLAGR
jgi:sodium transport system permease protein